MSKFVSEKVGKIYKNEKSSYKISKKTMSDMMNDTWDRATLDTFDKIIEILKTPEVNSLDLFTGEFHLLVLRHIDSLRGVNRLRLGQYKGLENLIEFTKKNEGESVINQN